MSSARRVSASQPSARASSASSSTSRAAVVHDVGPPAVLPAAEEGQNPVALGEPAVLDDDLGGRLRRQRARAVPAQQHPHQGGVERGDGHRVLDARADVAAAHLDRRIGVGRADVPPDHAAVLERLHAPVLVHQPVVFGPRGERAGQPGARQRADDVGAVRLVAGLAPGVEGRGTPTARAAAGDGGAPRSSPGCAIPGRRTRHGRASRRPGTGARPPGGRPPPVRSASSG